MTPTTVHEDPQNDQGPESALPHRPTGCRSPRRHRARPWSWSAGGSGRWFRSRLLEPGVRTAGAGCGRCLVATPRPPPAVAEGVCLVRRRSRGFRCPQSAMFEQPRWFVGVPPTTAAGLLTALPAVAAHKIAAAARASPLPLPEPSPARRSRRGPGGGHQAVFAPPRWSVCAARDGTDADPVAGGGPGRGCPQAAATAQYPRVGQAALTASFSVWQG